MIRKFLRQWQTISFVVAIFVSLGIFGCQMVPPQANSKGTIADGDSKGFESYYIKIYKGKNYTGQSATLYASSGNVSSLPFCPSSFKAYNGVRPLFYQNNFNNSPNVGEFFENAQVPDMDVKGFAGKATSMVFILPESARTVEKVAIVEGLMSSSDKNNRKRYLCADANFDQVPIDSTRYLRGEWETFDLIWLDPSKRFFALKAHNGKYVCTDYDRTNYFTNSLCPPLLANRSGIGLWEMYRVDFNGPIGNFQLEKNVYTARWYSSIGTSKAWNYILGDTGNKNYGKFSFQNLETKPDKALAIHPFTADPSASVMPVAPSSSDKRIFIFASHDIDWDPNTCGAEDFQMKDYYVYSLPQNFGQNDLLKAYYELGTKPDGVAIPSLDLENISWAERMLWAPDGEYSEYSRKYYLYFPAVAKEKVNGYSVFRIGVATSTTPEGPYTAQANYIAGTFSVDPDVIEIPGGIYIYFGGRGYGQLQQWKRDAQGNWYFDPNGTDPGPNEVALTPVCAQLSAMVELVNKPKPVVIYKSTNANGSGNPVMGSDTNIIFFEAPFAFMYNNKLCLTYSTGDSRNIVLAVNINNNNPYGPFLVKGFLLKKADVMGWTTHHSVVQDGNRWLLFYHSADVMGGKLHQRNMRYRDITSLLQQLVK